MKFSRSSSILRQGFQGLDLDPPKHPPAVAAKAYHLLCEPAAANNAFFNEASSGVAQSCRAQAVNAIADQNIAVRLS